ncbi:MAG: hypothetical protein IH898_02515 [Planctomycetes bacterium]|nr:hypothetical protein [Planctomycetota bacterium]
MNFSVKGAAALAFCLCLVYQQSVEAELFTRTRVSRSENLPAKKDSGLKQTFEVQQANRAEQAAAILASYNSFEASGLDGADYSGAEYSEIDDFCAAPCDGCLDDCCGCGRGGTGIMDRAGQFFLVGEYIYARANLSEALAYVVLDPIQPLDGLQVVEYDFDYKSSYRFSGGYRFCDCGGEIVFSYARYRGEADFFVQDTSASTAITIFGPYEANAPGDSGILIGEADIDVRSYDLSFSKTIPLGSPLGYCGACDDTCYDSCCDDSCCDDTCFDDTCFDDTCCSDCCSGWCPAWDITWSAGVRFAEAGWSRVNTSFESDFQDQVTSVNTRLDFEGAGARVGILGRRYFGQSGLMSAYAKCDISLLVGNMDIQTITIDNPDGSAPLAVVSHSNSGRRIIPVTEIEAGLTAHISNHVHLSSGYFLSAWHDLGFRDEYNFLGPQGGGFQLSHYDDANILGFDGFFARAEVTY